MASEVKLTFLSEIVKRFGHLEKLGDSQSLYRISGSDVRIYIRYSKVHNRQMAWYGLREIDLKQLEGYPALICFLWDGQTEPLLIPFSEYEDIFRSTTPASDGQYKVQIIMMQGGTEFYLARVGKFNAEAYYGWQGLEDLLDKTNHEKIPELSHSQVQTLLGSIGAKKDYDIWIPQIDRQNLDWNIAEQFFSRDSLPSGFERVNDVIQEVDVIWLKKGSNFIQGLFEVEHSTPVYSGLLRFNDILLSVPTLQTRYSIVANSERRSLFIKQLNRPTFQASGLNGICTFLDYGNVYNWHKRIAVQGAQV